jgi:hypothetical protein
VTLSQPTLSLAFDRPQVASRHSMDCRKSGEGIGTPQLLEENKSRPRTKMEGPIATPRLKWFDC